MFGSPLLYFPGVKPGVEASNIHILVYTCNIRTMTLDPRHLSSIQHKSNFDQFVINIYDPLKNNTFDLKLVYVLKAL